MVHGLDEGGKVESTPIIIPALVVVHSFPISLTTNVELIVCIKATLSVNWTESGHGQWTNQLAGVSAGRECGVRQPSVVVVISGIPINF